MRKFLLVILIGLSIAGCQRWGDSPHQAHVKNLVAEGLQEEAQRWESSARYALSFPIGIQLPYAERRILNPEQSYRATAFVASLAMDQRVAITVEPSSNSRVPVFVDVFERQSGEPSFKRLASKKQDQHQLLFEAPRQGQYIFRIQAGYRARGLVNIIIASQPKYIFPVLNTHADAVKSFFGAARDGGKRQHKGVDIFAEQGTPVVSVSAGRVHKAATTPRGGNNIWIRQGEYSFYYAHLHDIHVQQGQTISTGQTIGTVGNSGNARTTRPHLHFGLYKGVRGAIDPYPLIDDSHSLLEQTITEIELSPRWVAVKARELNVRAGPKLKADIVQTLRRHQLVQVEAVMADWLRVSTAEGFHGFIAREFIQQPNPTRWQLDQPYLVMAEPEMQAPVLSRLDAGEKVLSLGLFGPYRLITFAGGLQGWATVETPLLSTGDKQNRNET
ncbi:L-Ala--D-Glu endopeptidase [Thalassocella blandensis]|nr:L-Ala--D-Glu endopeptidase [Thalassocella blandensis]